MGNNLSKPIPPDNTVIDEFPDLLVITEDELVSGEKFPFHLTELS